MNQCVKQNSKLHLLRYFLMFILFLNNTVFNRSLKEMLYFLYSLVTTK